MKQKYFRKYKQSTKFRWGLQKVHKALQVLRWGLELQFSHANDKQVMFKIFAKMVLLIVLVCFPARKNTKKPPLGQVLSQG